MNIRHPRSAATVAALSAAGLLLTACGTTSTNDGTPSSHPTAGSMPGMAMSHGNGLSRTQDGYTLELKSGLMASMPMVVTFLITRDGRPVTDFQTEQTKTLHFYLIRDDLTGFQHLHPTMAANGTWSVTVPQVAAGHYRIYTQILPVGATDPVVLSMAATVPGSMSLQNIPATSKAVTVDGYTVTLDAMASNGHQLGVSFTKDGTPVTDLQPYLDTYAHVTAFHEGDLAFAHLHPTNAVTSAGSGPKLNFIVEVPELGTYRVFIQFMAAGKLHTAAVTTDIS